jgi:hypothetical protein
MNRREFLGNCVMAVGGMALGAGVIDVNVQLADQEAQKQREALQNSQTYGAVDNGDTASHTRFLFDSPLKSLALSVAGEIVFAAGLLLDEGSLHETMGEAPVTVLQAGVELSQGMIDENFVGPF